MDLSTATALLGAAAVGGLALYEGADSPFSVGHAAFMGAAGGSALGINIENMARYFRLKSSNRTLESLPNARQANIKKLVKAFDMSKLPVFVQEEGTPWENAAYYDSGTPEEEVPDAKWKNVLTGKRLRKFPNRAVYIGKKYNHIPVLAHELGHAVDFADKSEFDRSVAPTMYKAMMTGGAFVGGLAGVGSSALRGFGHDAESRVASIISMAGSAIGLLGAALYKARTKRLESTASRNALNILKGMQRKQTYEQSRDALTKAYRTYDPISVMDPFGSVENAV